MRNSILVRGARENNLKNVDVEIPRDALCVFTGLSGSGKSSLAFDTIYAEGRRRYVDSLSAYARQFLGQMDKPDVDVIEGLSPAISIDQKTTSRNPRSTVGTVTEIYDYLRLLWARAGTPHCPKCGREIRRQTVDQIVDKVLALPEGTRFQVLAPVVRGKKGEHVKVLGRRAEERLLPRDAWTASLYDLERGDHTREEQKAHTSSWWSTALCCAAGMTRRLTDSRRNRAEARRTGIVVIQQPDTGEETLFSRNYACDECGVSMPELSPRHVLVQQSHRRVPGVQRSRLPAEGRPRPHHPGPVNSPSTTAAFRPAAGAISETTPSRGCTSTRCRRNTALTCTPRSTASPKEAMDVILYGTGGEKLDAALSTAASAAARWSRAV